MRLGGLAIDVQRLLSLKSFAMGPNAMAAAIDKVTSVYDDI